MADNNTTDELKEIRRLYSFLDVFELSDSEIEKISILVSRVVIGSDTLDDFYSKIKKLNREGLNTQKIATAIVSKKFTNLETSQKPTPPKPPQIPKSPAKPKPLAPQTSISFSTEDDEEISKIIASLAPNNNNHNYSSTADAIIAKFGYNKIESDEMTARLKSIVISRLKDIRDEIETVENLKKGKEVGGLGLDDEQIKALLTIVNSEINIHKNTENTKTEEKEPASAQGFGEVRNKPIPFPVKRPEKKEKITINEKRRFDTEAIQREIDMSTMPKQVEQIKEKVRPPVKVEPVQTNGSGGVPQITEEDGLPVIKSPMGDDLMVAPDVATLSKSQSKSPVIPHEAIAEMRDPVNNLLDSRLRGNDRKHISDGNNRKPISTPKPQPFPRPQLQKEQVPVPKVVKSNKPMVDGIKVEPTLVGPVEELATMTLINFRRMGETPHQAIAKIEEKINLLEKESYGKRLEGIEAWHKSEVNKFYRLLGQESMSGEKSVNDIISERIAQNKPTLSIEELNSIVELNKKLRY